MEDLRLSNFQELKMAFAHCRAIRLHSSYILSALMLLTWDMLFPVPLSFIADLSSGHLS